MGRTNWAGIIYWEDAAHTLYAEHPESIEELEQRVAELHAPGSPATGVHVTRWDEKDFASGTLKQKMKGRLDE